MYAGSRIAVVVPARDEERLLPEVLSGMPSFVDLVVVVDDGSRDRTGMIARSWGPPVAVVEHPVSRGVGAAIAAGYLLALAQGADAVAVMAGDAQMLPSELASLVDPVVSGRCGYAKGDRTRHPEVRARMPAWRRLGNAVLTRWTRQVAGYPSLRDSQCGFTVLCARVLSELPLADLVVGYGYPNDLLVMLGERGVTLLEVPITPVYGDESSGITPWGAAWTHSRVLVRAWWRRRRGAHSGRLTWTSPS